MKVTKVDRERGALVSCDLALVTQIATSKRKFISFPFNLLVTTGKLLPIAS